MDAGCAPSEDEVRILLIGKTGVGKSTTGNTILDRKCFKTSAISQSVTTQCQWGKRSFNGQSLIVVDTPGLFDTGMSNEKIKMKIAAFTGIISPGPHAIVLVLKLGRYTKEEQATVKFFVQMFGENIFKHMVVLFTFRKLLEEEDEVMTFDDYLKTLEDNLKEFIRRAGDRCIAFGTGEDAKRTNDAERLIKMINSNIGRTYYSTETLEKVEEANRRIRGEMKHKATEPCSDDDLKSQLRNDYENEGPWYQRYLQLAGNFLFSLAEKALSVVGDVLIAKLKSKLRK